MEQGNEGIYFMGTRERYENDGDRDTKANLGNIGNKDFDLGATG